MRDFRTKRGTAPSYTALLYYLAFFYRFPVAGSVEQPIPALLHAGIVSDINRNRQVCGGVVQGRGANSCNEWTPALPMDSNSVTVNRYRLYLLAHGCS